MDLLKHRIWEILICENMIQRKRMSNSRRDFADLLAKQDRLGNLCLSSLLEGDAHFAGQNGRSQCLGFIWGRCGVDDVVLLMQNNIVLGHFCFAKMPLLGLLDWR